MSKVSVSVDFSRNTGKMKPVHGVNSGPRTKVFTYDASDLFRTAGIPMCRLHDVEYPYGSGEFVDIHCIFRNFDADENDPASYNFGLTDKYIEAIRDVGAKVMYRLGESIEHAPVKRYVHPPKDLAKWARVCEHIIRHYNEGWADGYRWNITYWEIWNEPDIDISREIKKMWSGSEEQFYDLFEVTAKHLKSCFPNIKVGGPAIAGNAAWADRFLKAISERDVPLDFFSWHKYSHDIDAYVKHDETMFSLLSKYGYADAEIFLDEWNYMENWSDQPPSFKKLVGMKGAAFCAAALVSFQHSHLTGAEYFEADVIKEWCGLFEVDDMAIGSFANNGSKCTLKPRKPFYAFSSFNELYTLGNEVHSESDEKRLYTAAAFSDNCGKVMLASYRSDLLDTPCEITLANIPDGAKAVRVFITDENNINTLEKEIAITDKTLTFTLSVSDDQIRVLSVE